MMRHHSNYRLARFESLEKKVPLAGDVLVSVVDGHLNIQGDADPNQIAVTAGAEAGAYVITGLEGTELHLVDPVTELPGPAVSTLTVTDVHGRANVELGDGDDEFALFDAQFHGKLKIDTGEGADQVNIGAQPAAGTELAGLLSEDVSVAVKGALSIDTGLGDDEIDIADAAIYGYLKVRAGDGGDLVSLGASTVAGMTALEADDLPDPTLRVFGAIKADLGEGDDVFAMVQVRAYGSVHVDSALGDDDLDIRLSHLSHLKVDGGDGADDAEVVDSIFAGLTLKMGDGDDVIATSNIRAKLATFSGGEGEDTLDELADSEIAHRIIRSIEVPALEDTPIFRRFCGFPWFGRSLFGRLFR